MLLVSVLLFSKLNKIFFGFFDPGNIFLDKKINNFRGELTDISAKKEVLVGVRMEASSTATISLMTEFYLNILKM